MLKIKKTLIFILITIIIIFAFQSIVFAKNFNPDEYEPETIGNDLEAVKIGNTIVSIFTYIGIGVAVISLSIIGLKFMTGSVEQKAQYKESLKPYFIGLVLLIGVVGFVNFLFGIASNFNK